MDGVSPSPEHPDQPRDAAGPDPSRAEEARRRARLAAVFGEVLPDTTGDERDPGSAGGRGEDWYRENRPPPHDPT